jgi:hypothetical protein
MGKGADQLRIDMTDTKEALRLADGLDGSAKTIWTREQAAAMLRTLAAEVEALRAALMAHEAAKDQLFAHCLSNGVFNAWGVAMDCAPMNDASKLACAALQGESK